MDYSKITALSFDCYGTLIDWDQGLSGALGAFDGYSTDEVLQHYAEIEAQVEQENPTMPYRDVVERCATRVSAQLNRPIDEARAQEIAASIGQWPPFADSLAALAELHKHCKLIVLSNVDRQSFAGSSAQLGDPFDAALTAEDVGSYKPDRRNFEALLSTLDTMGIDRDQHLHVAQSLFHDHAPAQAMGIRSVWINRRHGKSTQGASGPALDVTPNAEFPDMASFAAAIANAKSS